MFCGFRAGGGVCEQAIHQCARQCVFEAVPQGEECGKENRAHSFGDRDELCGARALQRYFSAFHGMECLVDGSFDPSFPHKAPMDFGGCGLVRFGFPLLDVFVERVHGSGVARMAGGGQGVQGRFDFLNQSRGGGV